MPLPSPNYSSLRNYRFCKTLCELFRDGIFTSWKFGFDSDPRLYDPQASCTWALSLCIPVPYGELTPSSFLNQISPYLNKASPAGLVDGPLTGRGRGGDFKQHIAVFIGISESAVAFGDLWEGERRRPEGAPKRGSKQAKLKKKSRVTRSVLNIYFFSFSFKIITKFDYAFEAMHAIFLVIEIALSWIWSFQKKWKFFSLRDWLSLLAARVSCSRSAKQFDNSPFSCFSKGSAIKQWFTFFIHRRFILTVQAVKTD